MDIVIWVISGIIGSVVCGVMVESIMTRKGYPAKYFWVGFFFNVLGLIYAAGMPLEQNSVRSIEKDTETDEDDYEDEYDDI